MFKFSKKHLIFFLIARKTFVQSLVFRFIILFFFIIGNQQTFTAASMIFIMRISITTDVVLIFSALLTQIYYIFFKKTTFVMKMLFVFLCMVVQLIGFMSLSSYLLVLALSS